MFNIGDEVRLVPGIEKGAVYNGITISRSMLFDGAKTVKLTGINTDIDYSWVQLDNNYYYPDSVVELFKPLEYDIPDLEEFNQLLMLNNPTFLSEDS